MVSAAQQLVATPPATPPFDIMRAAFVELRVTDLAASEHFYAGLLGMLVSSPDRRGDLPARLGGAPASLPHPAPGAGGTVPAAARLGFRARTEGDLDRARGALRAARLPMRWIEAATIPGMGRALRVWDPFGYPLEFFHAIEQCRDPAPALRPASRRADPALRPPQPPLAARRGRVRASGCRSAFAAPSTSPPTATATADERITGAWLLRKPTVHDVALTAGTGPRLHHFAYWIAEPAGVAARLRPARRRLPART